MKKIFSLLLLSGFILSSFGTVAVLPIKAYAQEENKTEPTISSQPYHPYYNLKIRVLSPNGGEVWSREKIQTISWGVAKSDFSKEGFVSIDLYRIDPVKCVKNKDKEKCISSSSFVRHIGNANVQDGSYSWKIAKDIEDGKNYVVRISNQYVLERKEELKNNVLETGSDWDESDGPFNITSQTTPPIPQPNLEEAVRALEELSTTLEKAVQQLAKIIALLKGINVTFQ